MFTIVWVSLHAMIEVKDINLVEALQEQLENTPDTPRVVGGSKPRSILPMGAAPEEPETDQKAELKRYLSSLQDENAEFK